MAFRASFSKRIFRFHFDARTSRGLLREKPSWFIKVWDEADRSVFGLGECSPVPKLSPDDVPDLEVVVDRVAGNITGMERYSASGLERIAENLVPPGFPSVRFAVETALLDLLNGGQRIVFMNDFTKKNKAIAINGLIWMGDTDLMLQQATLRIEEGHRCIKMKVGGLNFEKECDILHYIRKKYFREDITIRLDANGAFKPADALLKLHELARYDIHSIEQPVRSGLSEMAEICRKSPIPVALDEELIGVGNETEKRKMLTTLKPAYIVLKPTLHGGFAGCDEWARVAQKESVGYWITSALESNVGLNAICQYAANFDIDIPQGLGTGTIYEDNIPSPLRTKNGNISLVRGKEWDLEGF